MCIDANTAALSAHLAKEEQRENDLEEFQKDIINYLALIESSINSIKEIAENYPNCDLDQEIRESLEELL